MFFFVVLRFFVFFTRYFQSFARRFGAFFSVCTIEKSLNSSFFRDFKIQGGGRVRLEGGSKIPPGNYNPLPPIVF